MIPVDQMKKAIGYERETDMCKNCVFNDWSNGKCYLNPTFPWSPNQHGICENHRSDPNKLPGGDSNE